MKKLSVKSLFVLGCALVLSLSFTMAQEKTEKTKKEKSKKECCAKEKGHSHSKMSKSEKSKQCGSKMKGMDHSGHDHGKHEGHKHNSDLEEKGNKIVRKGVIDLKAIDKNKDGKVYQDQMCWNVISDEAGSCPLCDMTLKEVTLDKAKINLLNNKYKVKDN